jgi:phosphoribosylglycinamide formyltransferase-1
MSNVFSSNTPPQYPTKKVKNLAIFASGSGSNAKKIIEYLANHLYLKVRLVVCNRREAGVLKIAEEHQIETLIIRKSKIYENKDLLIDLQTRDIDFIALAGFLLLVPDYIIENYHNKILNIHPALLPKFGGKGMFGMNVHEAVKAAGETESGITIHYANERYDEGDYVLQVKVLLDASDSPSDIARKVLEVEHFYFPKVIAQQMMLD